MTPEQKERCEKLLRQAWISPTYLSSRLGSFGEIAAELAVSMKHPGVPEELMATGACHWFSGTDSRDALMTYGGVFAVRSHSVRSVHLSTLADILDERDMDRLPLITDVELLMVNSFYDRSIKECPLEPRARFRVEDFLLTRQETGLSIAISSSHATTVSDWWSASFLATVARSYTLITT